MDVERRTIGTIAALFVNANRKKGAQRVKPEDFFPYLIDRAGDVADPHTTDVAGIVGLFRGIGGGK